MQRRGAEAVDHDHLQELTSAELLALRLTLRGQSLKQLAYELDVSNALACQIRRTALRKVGAQNVYSFVTACASGAVAGFESAKLGVAEMERMTPAEHEVARHAALGLSNASIARERGTAMRTVANQLASLYRKWNVQSRLELVLAISRAGRL